MDTPEIVQGLKRLNRSSSDLWESDYRTLDAAIARLTATCAGCSWFRVHEPTDGKAYWWDGWCQHEDTPCDRVTTGFGCQKHTPRVPAREGGE